MCFGDWFFLKNFEKFHQWKKFLKFWCFHFKPIEVNNEQINVFSNLAR